MRKVYQTQSIGLTPNKRATIYRNGEWQEFIVKFYIEHNGKWVHAQDADYHESFSSYQALESAKSTADNYVKG